MKQWIIMVLCLMLLHGVCTAGDKAVIQDEKDRVNYSVGYQIGWDFKRQKVEINPEALVRGIQDALAETKPLMTEEEMRSTLVTLKQKIVAEEEEQRQARLEELRAEGQRFLAENATREGVVTLPSGLQYQVIQEGTGKKPTLQDIVTVNYRGTRINGIEVDSSYKDNKPVIFPLNKAIPGWQEALPMMQEGARWKVFLPPDLAFGDKGPLEGQTVIYEIELLSVVSSR
jgi:FKBP-type peptidyl-prolyl cis-trans isomerase FklB